MPSRDKVPDHRHVLNDWIRKSTSGSKCVVDFGAGRFDKLEFVPPMVKKVGIEVFPAYLGYAKPGIKVVLGDFRNWNRYVSGPELDTAMLIDTLEHIPKEDGIQLLSDLQSAFRKILVFTPDGFQPQENDNTGFENEWQIHECGWNRSELESLGFSVTAHDGFHGDGLNALFALWERG